MPRGVFTPEVRARAQATREANKKVIRESSCREGCGRQATVTAGLGRGMCRPCNERRKRASKRDQAQQQQAAAPRAPRGESKSSRKPRGTQEPPAPPVADPVVEGEPDPAPRKSGKRSRLGAIVGAALNTSISGKRVTD